MDINEDIKPSLVPASSGDAVNLEPQILSTSDTSLYEGNISSLSKEILLVEETNNEIVSQVLSKANNGTIDIYNNKECIEKLRPRQARDNKQRGDSLMQPIIVLKEMSDCANEDLKNDCNKPSSKQNPKITKSVGRQIVRDILYHCKFQKFERCMQGFTGYQSYFRHLMKYHKKSPEEAKITIGSRLREDKEEICKVCGRKGVRVKSNYCWLYFQNHNLPGALQ